MEGLEREFLDGNLLIIEIFLFICFIIFMYYYNTPTSSSIVTKKKYSKRIYDEFGESKIVSFTEDEYKNKYPNEFRNQRKHTSPDEGAVIESLPSFENMNEDERKREHEATKALIIRYEAGEKLSPAAFKHLNSLGLIDNTEINKVTNKNRNCEKASKRIRDYENLSETGKLLYKIHFDSFITKISKLNKLEIEKLIKYSTSDILDRLKPDTTIFSDDYYDCLRSFGYILRKEPLQRNPLRDFFLKELEDKLDEIT